MGSLGFRKVHRKSTLSTTKLATLKVFATRNMDAHILFLNKTMLLTNVVQIVVLRKLNQMRTQMLHNHLLLVLPLM